MGISPLTAQRQMVLPRSLMHVCISSESIQDTDRDVATQALNFLVNVMQQSYPDKDTPSEKSVWHDKAYQEWKTWWDTKGQKYFERIANQ